MKKNKFNSKKKEDRPNSPFEIRKKFCPFNQPGSQILITKILDYYLDTLLKKEKLYLAE